MLCGTILVVEDDASTRELFASLLERAGYVTVTAPDGETALELAETRPGLALIDVQLPGISGIDVCRALRSRYGERLPIMLVSGERSAPEDRAAGLRHGADDYVSKPFYPDELLARVDRLSVRGQPDGHDVAEAARSIRLTDRERQVLSLLADGLSHRDISGALAISSKTTATHIQRILAKLQVHSRAAAVARAYRLRLVDADRIVRH
jgi:DNA-binding response OmpR family regulator